MPDIAFCIPTYNFAKFLPATLDSIIEQADQNIEIVIVDGGSTDETDDIIRLYQEKFPQLVYFKRNENCGVDRDIAKTLKLASSDYCWLFSADDILKPGAIQAMRGLIAKGGWNALITNFTICDFSLNPLSKHDIMNSSQDILLDWSVPQQREEYLQRASTSTAFFSYISSVVVNRKDWLEADGCEDFYGTCWIIAAKAMAMAKNHLRVYYHDGELLLKRGDNDSFISRGIPWRVKLALHVFPSIAERTFGSNTPEYQAFRRVVRNEITFGSILGFKAQLEKNKELRNEFYDVIKKYWMRKPSDKIFYLVFRLFPARVLKFIKTRIKKYPALFRKLKKMAR